MALPASITPITVSGTYVGADGSPRSGSLLFTPSVTASTAGAVLPIAPARVDLDTAGSFEVDLAATDDPDWDAPGFTYLVTERIEGARARSYSIEVPADSAGGELDLATASPVSTPGVPSAFLAVGKEVRNVADFGALGDNTADDTAEIQAAIDSLPTGGGVVYFPTGTYKLSAALVLASGVTLAGSGDVTIVLRQTSTSASCVTGSNVERVGLRNLQLVGPGSGTGHGLSLVKGAGDHVSYVSLTDVTVTDFGGDGIRIENAIVSRLDRVVVQSCGGWGFNLFGQDGGSSGTSTALDACYANDCDTGGFRLFKMAYSALNACAVDSCPVGYRLEDDFNVTLTGCGGEGNTSTVEIDGGYGNMVMSFFLYGNAGSGVHVFGNAQAVTLAGVVEVEPAGGATVCLDIDSGSTAHVLNCQNQTANSITGGTAFSITPAGGVSSPSGAYFEGSVTSGSGDVVCVTSSKGFVLRDRSNANSYRLKVTAGVLAVEVVA